MNEFKFSVGDVLKVNDEIVSICSPANVEKQYKDCLRVEYRFWDGQDNIYVVTAEDGISMLLMEKDAALQERGETTNAFDPGKSDSPLIEKETYRRLRQIGVLNTSVRAYNRGTSDYSQHTIQPWSIWLDYGLNPWDADIVKRILRKKEGDSRRLDYEKIIHICEERIRQIECEND